MSSALYDKGREGILDDTIEMSTDTIKAVLVDTGAYTPNMATDANLSDIASGARIATSGALTGKTFTGGVFDADDPTIASVSGTTVELIVLIKDTGVAATSRLIAKVDTATGLPATPGGGPILITWDNGSNKIFKL